MAVAKSIEPPTESSASNEAQRPAVHLNMKPLRSFTVSCGERGPRLRIEGQWLRAAGFDTGSRVKVLVMPGWLLVEAIPIPREPEPKRRLSWAHKYPIFPPVDLYSTDLPPLEVRIPPCEVEQAQRKLGGKQSHGDKK
jgi:hypothetical protein